MDANKRTALNCALIWLALHDLRLDATQDALYGLTLGVAQGQIPLTDAVDFFEAHARPQD